MPAPSILESHMFFHSIVMLKHEIQEKVLKYSGSYSKGTLLGYNVQKFLKALTAFVEAANLASLAWLVSP